MCLGVFAVKAQVSLCMHVCVLTSPAEAKVISHYGHAEVCSLTGTLWAYGSRGGGQVTKLLKHLNQQIIRKYAIVLHAPYCVLRCKQLQECKMAVIRLSLWRIMNNKFRASDWNGELKWVQVSFWNPKCYADVEGPADTSTTQSRDRSQLLGQAVQQQFSTAVLMDNRLGITDVSSAISAHLDTRTFHPECSTCKYSNHNQPWLNKSYTYSQRCVHLTEIM